jgi:Tol biopolymer transport system component
MKRIGGWLVVVMAVAAGCFPVALDVDSRGRALVPRHEGVFAVDLKTGEGQLVARGSQEARAAWARWSPDGKAAMVVWVSDSGFLVDVVTLEDGKRRQVAKCKTLAMALWSPDGKIFSVAEVGASGARLKVIDVAGGSMKSVLASGASSHQWTPDGKIVVFQPNESDDDAAGRVLLVDPAGGEPRPIAEARAEATTVLSLSPDGKRLLMVEKRDDNNSLVRIDMADGARQVLMPEGVRAGIWSPDGKRIAVTRTDSGGDDDGLTLMLTDPDGKQPRQLATGLMENTGEPKEAMPVYPSWAGNDTLIFFRKVAVYGTSGKSMRLFRVNADGTEIKDMQWTVDCAVAAALKGKDK